MRQIKFRAWDKINKRMVFPYSIDLVREHEDIEQGQYYFEHSAIDFDDAILMQFTGLLDKNDKEIYEGDIVEIDAREGGKFSGKIIFCDKTASFKFHDFEDKKNYTLYATDQNSFLVTGNIHENAR